MPMLPFMGAAYAPRYRATDAQRCVNLYPEIREAPQDGKEGLSLSGTPGLRRFAALPTGGPIRGLHLIMRTGQVFAVGNTRLYELNSVGGTTLRGTLTSEAGNVSLADNGLELVLVDGANGYVLNLTTNVFTPISDPDFPGATVVQFIDGYFIFNRPGSAQWFLSHLYSAGAYDALDFATAEGLPDQIVGVIADHREVWLFGSHSTEVWFNNGAPDFPFSRIGGAFIEHGCSAPLSVAKLDNSVFWLGRDLNGWRMIWRAQGYQPQRLSTHAVEFSLQQQGDLAGATAYTYQDDGHSFYCLNCRDTTWVYDAATGLWHERQALRTDGTFTRHRAQGHVFAFGKHLVGDVEDGRLYDLSLTQYTDDGVAIVRERIGPELAQGDTRMAHRRLHILMETGRGLDGGAEPGRVPQLLLDWSDDHGAQWSDPVWGTSGPLGARMTRVVWRRLGQSRGRHYRLRTSDPTPVALVGAVLNPEG